MEVGVGVDNPTNFRVEGFADEHLCGFLGSAECHHHGFGSCCGTIVHGSIGDVHARELGHHALVFKDVVEGALGNLCLVRRIASEELRAFDEVLHDGRCIVIVAPCSSKHREWCIQLGKGTEVFAEFNLALSLRQVVLVLEVDSFRNIGIEFFKGAHARFLQHLLQVIFRMGEIFVIHCCFN